MNGCVLDREAVTALLVAPIVLLMIQRSCNTKIMLDTSIQKCTQINTNNIQNYEFLQNEWE